jgi:hypothetical protein
MSWQCVSRVFVLSALQTVTADSIISPQNEPKSSADFVAQPVAQPMERESARDDSRHFSYLPVSV